MADTESTNNKREVVSIHVGQAGIQMGAICWELYRLEHNLDEIGQQKEKSSFGEYEDDDNSFASFFEEKSTGKYKGRAVFVDTGPYNIAALRRNPQSHIFNSNQLVGGLEDSANNFASGYYGAGREVLREALERVRKQAEEADTLQGFLLFHSYGGGTGSGFTALLSERLDLEYPKRQDIRFAVLPSSKTSSAVVEPYNSIFMANNSILHSDATFVLDNTTLYETTFSQLGIEKPTFSHINGIISQAVSSVTGSLRFQGALNMNLDDICTNLVPFPRLNFLHADYAPLLPQELVPFNTLSTKEITDMCFQPIAPPCTSGAEISSRVLHSPVFMACSLMYRGQVSPGEVTSAIQKMIRKKSARFISWTPTGFKVGINYQPVITVPGLGLSSVPRSVCRLANSITAGHDWDTIAHKFDMMYKKRAFLFWYLGEGMEETEFDEARENVAALQKDYLEISDMVPPIKAEEDYDDLL